MAGVAVHAVVHVSANAGMFEIGRDVIPMATGALESRIGCRGAGMAICANPARVAVIDVEKFVSERRP